jgi:hypothetical protein
MGQLDAIPLRSIAQVTLVFAPPAAALTGRGIGHYNMTLDRAKL